MLTGFPLCVEKELNQSSGVNVGSFSDLDIEIIEVGNKYEDFKCGWPTRDCWRVVLKLLEVDILVLWQWNKVCVV